MKLVIERTEVLNIADMDEGHIVTTSTGLIGITTDEGRFPVIIISDKESGGNMSGVLLTAALADALHWFDGGKVIISMEEDWA